MSEHTAVPHSPLPKLKFEPQEIYQEHARLTGKPLAEHEGFNRVNDGAWIITDENGRGLITVKFLGKAKRGEGWNAPDPEGQAIARGLVRAVNAHEALVKALEAMLIVAEGYVRICEINGYFHEAADVAVEQARAALTLAKGETQ